MRKAIVGAWVLLLGSAAAAHHADDPLAAMRLALGGDANINAVARFSVTGSTTRTLSAVSESSGYEVLCEFPDKFMTTRRSTVDPSGMPPSIRTPSISITVTSGFNGDSPIDRMSGDTLPNGMPSVFRAPASTAPDDVAEARRRRVSNAHREFLRFVLPRFGQSFPGSAVKIETVEPASIDGRAVYQVRITDWGSRVEVLAIDAATNLPARLTWQDRPVVSMSLGTVVNSGVAPTATMPRFPADPTAGMPDVDHVLTFKKFKSENGLNWPHQVSKTVDGKPDQEWTFGKVNLAPKFKPDTFASSR